MKSIHTLIPDIYALLKQKDGWFNADLAGYLSNDISGRLLAQLGEETQRNTLRLSKMGPQCSKALWYSVHHPELREALPPWAKIKYSFGHILEALAITLAKAAGHTVTGEQDVVSVDGVDGHRDCVIDGCVVDVKSSASKSFIKFKDGSIEHSDNFGYLEQLDGYIVGSASDPLVTVKDRGYLLVIDKQLGHMVLYEHKVREAHIRQRIKEYKQIVACETPPACTCGTRPSGASGNIELDLRASYSPYKHICFPHLRTFIQAKGPVYLTTVVRRPKLQDGRDAPEVDRFGNFI